MLYRSPARTLAMAACLGLSVAAPHAQTQGQSAASNWQAIGPNLDTVLSLALNPFDTKQRLAGTYFGGLYRSLDWGYSWQPVGQTLSNRSVFALAYAPSTPNRVFAGTFEDGVHRSDDGGITWVKRSTGLTDLDIQALAVHPGNGSYVVAATANGGLFASFDAGEQWAQIPGTQSTRGRALVFDNQDSGALFVGTIGDGVYKSRDGGLTWAPWNQGLSPTTITALHFDPQGTLYAATDGGVFSLAANGSTWVDINHNLPKLPVTSIYAHPTVPGLVFAATHFGVYSINNPQNASGTWYQWTTQPARLVTTDPTGFVFHVAAEHGDMKMTWDYGKTWIRGDTGMQNTFVGALAQVQGTNGPRVLAGTDLGIYAGDVTGWKPVLPLTEAVFDLKAKDGTVYAGTESTGVWKSADAGVTWSHTAKGIVPTQVSTFSLQAAQTGQDGQSAPPRQLFAATAAGVFSTVDEGAHWQAIRLPQASVVRSVAADPVRGPIVYLGGHGQVWRSVDGGKTFGSSSAGLPDEDIVKLVHAPWDRVYAVTAKGSLYATSDDNRNWYASQSGCEGTITSVVVDPVQSWVLYAGTAGGGVCKSESAGQSWTSANTGITQPYINALWVDPLSPKTVLAGSVDRIYRSVDAAKTWQSVQSGLPTGVVSALQGSSSAITAMVAGKGLYRSVDGGSTWTPANTTADIALATAVWQSPDNPARLMLGTPSRGILLSTDGGKQWADSSEGMSLFVRSLSIDPDVANRVYAASLGGGLFRSDDAGAQWRNIGLSERNIFNVRTASASRLLAGTSLGISQSNDAGDSWAELGQRNSYVLSMLVDPRDTRRVMVGSFVGEVWWTADGGTQWLNVGKGLPAADILAMTRCGNDKVYAALEREGIWQSSFAVPGAWSRISRNGLENVQVLSMACDPRSGFLYAASNAQGLYMSMDGGVNWQAVNSGTTGANELNGLVLTSVLPSPTTSWQVWVGVRNGTVKRSDDGGLHWAAADTGLPAAADVRGLTGAADGSLLAATGQGLYRLAPGTTKWAKVASLPGGLIRAVWADPAQTGQWVLAVEASGVYGTSNSGGTWTTLSIDAGALQANVLAGDAQRLYLGTLGRGLMWRTGTASVFNASQDPNAIPQVVTALVDDPQDANTLLVATGGQGVLKSTDGGAHWRSANTGLGQLYLLTLTRDATRPGVLYTGTTGGGVYMSRDNGESWQAFNDGLFNKNVTALSLDNQSPPALLVGTEGGGAYRHDAP